MKKVLFNGSFKGRPFTITQIKNKKEVKLAISYRAAADFIEVSFVGKTLPELPKRNVIIPNDTFSKKNHHPYFQWEYDSSEDVSLEDILFDVFNVITSTIKHGR